MTMHYDKQFKLDAVQYYFDHKELGLKECANNLGVSHQTLGRWKKELIDNGDIQHSGRMTELLYQAVSEKTETAQRKKRRVSVSGMLKSLGVSTSGYYAWKNHQSSNTQKRKEHLKNRIIAIYNDTHQIYAASKITETLREEDQIISERTVAIYMKELDIQACWVKPWTITTTNSNFSSKLQNVLDHQFNPEKPNAV